MVTFWDTSAVLPLLVTEPGTRRVRPILDRDPAIAVWWATRIECASALARRQREGAVQASSLRSARAVLTALAQHWTEINPTEPLRRRAERLLAVHPLHAADAMQLAAALQWARDDAPGNRFVCFDERLRAAAGREGFEVLPGA